MQSKEIFNHYLIFESIDYEIHKILQKDMINSTDKVLSIVKDRLVKQFAPKIRAWGLENSHNINIDKKYKGLIHRAINNPESIVLNMYKKSLMKYLNSEIS